MRQLSGAILVVIAAIGFGFMGLFGSWAMNAGVSVEMMLFLRFAIAGAIMSIILVGRGEGWPRGLARSACRCARRGRACCAGARRR